ncbi:nirA-like transcription factor [Fusarium heterosporum]|uniref:NirA-like transcription factor n=1 Tax=Fusarium heterosporum TaxID=42747 RepID=A0A8H5WEW6_FUSHE|nr:nirA-like transcription factor [Fusarium heterosporum]
MAHSAGAEDAPDLDVTVKGVTPKSHAVRQTNKQQVRHRASVACASCRDRRIRCVVPRDQTQCNACSKSGAECIIKNDDERRRPISKAYMSSLSDRISMLEGLLLERGVVPPPATHPPQTRHGFQEGIGTTASTSDLPMNFDSRSPGSEGHSPPDSYADDSLVHEGESGADHTRETLSLPSRSNDDSPFHILDAKQEDIIHRLLSTKGNLSFDQISGRLRFFGPTANSHVYAESTSLSDSCEPPDQIRRAERIIQSLSPETHDYLLDGFFQYYNSVIQIIDRDAFEADRITKSSKFYSHFLHITVLATGYRAADVDREDMRKITVNPRESSLHREAKHMLDIELERPGGIPSVQALLLLGDLECGVGRDNTGWMYSGMANRLAFDIGLHLDCTSNMSGQDTKIRNLVMQACVIYDRYWGLFLGRPLAIKSQDVDLLSNRFSQLTSFGLDAPKSDLTSEIYEQLIELMELAGRIVEIRDLSNSDKAVESKGVPAVNEAEENRYLQVINLDRQLQNWYRRLPDRMAWKPSNVKTAPYSFFLLHQQYHVTMILLHRPWAKYGSITSDSTSTGSQPSSEADRKVDSESPGHHSSHVAEGCSMSTDDRQQVVRGSRTSLARSICTHQAIRVARIFWQHRQRFDGRKIFITGIQHAGTASIALIAALAYQRSEPNFQTYIGYLEILSDAVGDMSSTYHPASRMHDLLKAVLEQIRSSMHDPTRSRSGSMGHQTAGGGASSARSGLSYDSNSSASVVPVRREADEELSQPLKKRRPSVHQQAPDFASSKSAFLGLPSHPTSFSTDKAYNTPYAQQSQPPLDLIMFPMNVHSQSDQLGLNLMGGPGVNVHHAEMPSGHMAGGMDHTNLANPLPGNWGLPTMQQPFVPGQFHGAVDWTSETAGLSASSVLNQSAAMSTGIMSGMTVFGSAKEPGKFGGNEGTINDTTSGKLPQIGANWANNGVGSVVPANADGYGPNIGKPLRVDNDNEQQRNYSLDFFNFS